MFTDCMFFNSNTGNCPITSSCISRTCNVNECTLATGYRSGKTGNILRVCYVYSGPNCTGSFVDVDAGGWLNWGFATQSFKCLS
jgi:hypothetical protein